MLIHPVAFQLGSPFAHRQARSQACTRTTGKGDSKLKVHIEEVTVEPNAPPMMHFRPNSDFMFFLWNPKGTQTTQPLAPRGYALGLPPLLPPTPIGVACGLCPPSPQTPPGVGEGNPQFLPLVRARNQGLIGA